MDTTNRIFFVEDTEPDFGDFGDVERYYRKMVEGFEIVFDIFCVAWKHVGRECIKPDQDFVDLWRNKEWELTLDLMENCTDLLAFTAMAYFLYEEANEHSLPILRLLDHERRLYVRWLKEVFEQRAHRWQARLERNFPNTEEQLWILEHLPRNVE